MERLDVKGFSWNQRSHKESKCDQLCSFDDTSHFFSTKQASDSNIAAIFMILLEFLVLEYKQ